MADPPDHREAHVTMPTNTAPPQSNAAAPEDPKTFSTNIGAPQTNAASDSSANAEDCLAAADAVAAISTSRAISNTTPALEMVVATDEPSVMMPNSQDAAAVSEDHAIASADSSPSLFVKLPGELRNRIYRAYFEDSARQRKHTMDIRKAAPTFLNLFHTDRMIRAEAKSIFFKEFLAIDSFFAPNDLEAAITLRIKSICALVAIGDMSLPLSITVQESIPGYTFYGINMRSDFVGKLMRFVTNETNEWFARSTGSQKPEKGSHLLSTQNIGPESMIHSSHRYRVERLHPDAGEARWYNRFNADEHVSAQQFLGLQGAYQPIRKDADFLRVDGPLAELDWSKFDWSFVGASDRWRLPRTRIYRAR